MRRDKAVHTATMTSDNMNQSLQRWFMTRTKAAKDIFETFHRYLVGEKYCKSEKKKNHPDFTFILDSQKYSYSYIKRYPNVFLAHKPHHIIPKRRMTRVYQQEKFFI